MQRVEDWLQRAEQYPQLAGGPFDYISVCPPYEAVSYPELFSLLNTSPLLHPDSYVVVEYARKFEKDIADTVGPLIKLKSRKYGRTLLAIYGPE